MPLMRRVVDGLGVLAVAVGAFLAIFVDLSNWTTRISLLLVLAGSIYTMIQLLGNSERTKSLLEELRQSREHDRGVDADARVKMLDFAGESRRILTLLQRRAQVDAAFQAAERDKLTKPHVFAASERTVRAYGEADRLTDELERLRDAKANKMDIDETEIVGPIAATIAKHIPDRSVWLGVTHLTEPWSDGTPGRGIGEFKRTLQARSASGEVTILRLYCLAARSDASALRQHLRAEIDAGIVVRLLYDTPDRPRPPDMSLVFTASDGAKSALSTQDAPANWIQDEALGSKLCALAFDARAGHFLDRVTITSPDSEDFRRLCNRFDESWRVAERPPKAVLSEI